MIGTFQLDAPVFEDDAVVAGAAALAGLGAEFTGLLRDAARALAGRPELLDAMRRAQHVLFDTEDDQAGALRRLDSAAGPLADRAHQLLVLDVVRLLLQRQGRRGIPEEVTRAVIDCQPALWLRTAERELTGTALAGEAATATGSRSGNGHRSGSGWSPAATCTGWGGWSSRRWTGGSRSAGSGTVAPASGS